MLGHDKAHKVHKVQSVKSNFMFRGLQKMTIHRKAVGLRCWHFWYGPWKAWGIFKVLEGGLRLDLSCAEKRVRSEVSLVLGVS